jgi:Zn finger protein HypA/HybF involved in hydrogenase expression
MNETPFGTIKAMTDCSHCGSPVMLNGPLLKVNCTSCQNSLNFSVKFWNGMVSDLEELVYTQKPGSIQKTTIMTEGYTFKVTLSREIPECSKCKTDLSMMTVAPNSNSIFCGKCGTENEISKPPKWFRTSSAKQIIGGVKESKGRADQATLNQMTPIAMQCPNCASSLKISQEVKRVTACEYCQSEFYIPDPIWNRLHPVKVAKNWGIRFEGKPDFITRREQKNLKRQRKDQQNQQKEKLGNQRREIVQKINKVRNGKFSVVLGYFICLFIGIFAIGFPIIFVKPVTVAFGEKICDGEFSVTTTSSSRGNKQSTSFHYFCEKDGIQKNINAKFNFMAMGGGVVFTFSAWTLLAIMGFFLRKRKIAILNKELEIFNNSHRQ